MGDKLRFEIYYLWWRLKPSGMLHFADDSTVQTFRLHVLPPSSWPVSPRRQYMVSKRTWMCIRCWIQCIQWQKKCNNVAKWTGRKWHHSEWTANFERWLQHSAPSGSVGIAVAFETKTSRTWDSVITKEQVRGVGQPVNTWDVDSDSGRMLIGDKTRIERKQLIPTVRVSEGKLQKP
jgi:hypothetical protein